MNYNYSFLTALLSYRLKFSYNKDQFFFNAHFSISFQLGFLPYIRIPVLYIFPLSHTEKIKPPISRTMERVNCQYGTVPGTPNGIRAIIMIGELKGIMLPQTAIGPVGSFMATGIIAIEKITNSVIGKLNDCASRISSLTALPIAAYKDA
jgi:hypothetical protein